MTHILDLPNELLRHIGNYLSDVDRFSSLLSCRTFADALSYVGPERRIGCGRILLSKQTDFLYHLRAKMKKIRNVRKIFYWKNLLICNIRSSYEPYFLTLLALRSIAPVIVMTTYANISCLAYTIRKYFDNEISYIVIRNKPPIRSAEMADLCKRFHIVMLPLPLPQWTKELNSTYETNACIISSKKANKYEIESKLIAARCIITPNRSYIRHNVILMVHISREPSRPNPRKPKHMKIFDIKASVIHTGERIRRPHFSIDRRRNEENRMYNACASILQAQIGTVRNMYPSPFVFLQRWRVNKEHVRQSACRRLSRLFHHIYRKHGPCPIFYLQQRRDQLSERHCDSFISDLITHLTLSRWARNSVISHLPSHSVSDRSTYAMLRGCERVVENKGTEYHIPFIGIIEGSHNVIPPIRAKHIILMSECENDTMPLRGALGKFTFENDDGQRIVSGNIKIHYISIRKLSTFLYVDSPYAPGYILGIDRFNRIIGV